MKCQTIVLNVKTQFTLHNNDHFREKGKKLYMADGCYLIAVNNTHYNIILGLHSITTTLRLLLISSPTIDYYTCYLQVPITLIIIVIIAIVIIVIVIRVMVIYIFKLHSTKKDNYCTMDS